MMAKAPLNIPAPMDRAKLRGRERSGVVTGLNIETNWGKIKWDDSGTTTIVHIWELEKIATDIVNRIKEDDGALG